MRRKKKRPEDRKSSGELKFLGPPLICHVIEMLICLLTRAPPPAKKRKMSNFNFPPTGEDSHIFITPKGAGGVATAALASAAVVVIPRQAEVTMNMTGHGPKARGRGGGRGAGGDKAGEG